ncbi:MAG: hypothetical protein ACP5QT_04410 [Brevinematia bacterium]
MKKKEEKIPSFDDLKNPDYVYYYSRSERIARRRKKELFETQDRKRVKGVLGYLSGGNPQVKTFISFYLLVALIFWLFTYFNNPSRTAEKKTIKIANNRVVKVSLVKTKELNGVNIIFENNSKESWIVTNLVVRGKNLTIETNLNLKVDGKGFEAIFLQTDTPVSIRNINVVVK